MKRRTFLLTSAVAALFTRSGPAPAEAPQRQLAEWPDVDPQLFSAGWRSDDAKGYLFKSSCANNLPDLNGNCFTFNNLRTIERQAPGKPVYLGFDHKAVPIGFVVSARLVDRGGLLTSRPSDVELITFLDERFLTVEKSLYTAVACLVNPTETGHSFDRLLHFGLVDNPLDQKLVPISLYTL